MDEDRNDYSGKITHFVGTWYFFYSGNTMILKEHKSVDVSGRLVLYWTSSWHSFSIMIVLYYVKNNRRVKTKCLSDAATKHF